MARMRFKDMMYYVAFQDLIGFLAPSNIHLARSCLELYNT